VALKLSHLIGGRGGALSFTTPFTLSTESHWSATWVTSDLSDSVALYALITRNGNNVGGKFTVVDPEAGAQTFSAYGTISGNNFTMSGTFDLSAVTINGSLICKNLIIGTYTQVGSDETETGQFILYKDW